MEFKHINDVWEYLDQFKTVDELEEAFGEIPSKFGSFEISNKSTIEEEESIEISNSYWDGNVGDYKYHYHYINIEDFLSQHTWFNIWLLGFDADGHPTDFKEFLGDSPSENNAFYFAQEILGLEYLFSNKDCDKIRRSYPTVETACVVVEKIRDLGPNGAETIDTTEFPEFSIR